MELLTGLLGLFLGAFKQMSSIMKILQGHRRDLNGDSKSGYLLVAFGVSFYPHADVFPHTCMRGSRRSEPGTTRGPRLVRVLYLLLVQNALI